MPFLRSRAKDARAILGVRSTPSFERELGPELRSSVTIAPRNRGYCLLDDLRSDGRRRVEGNM